MEQGFGRIESGNIFINYRRGDDSGFAQALFAHLSQAFSREQLFMDVDSIEPGLDFVRVLSDQVAQCDILISIVGKNWADACDANGARRLDNPDDFVRVEIEAALQQDKRVIPVLVGQAEMPRSDQLPDTLKPLVRRNAVRLTHEHFGSDTQILITALQRALKSVEDARSAQVQEAAARQRAEEEAERAEREARAAQRAEAERLKAEKGRAETEKRSVAEAKRLAKNRPASEAEALHISAPIQQEKLGASELQVNPARLFLGGWMLINGAALVATAMGQLWVYSAGDFWALAFFSIIAAGTVAVAFATLAAKRWSRYPGMAVCLLIAVAVGFFIFVIFRGAFSFPNTGLQMLIIGLLALYGMIALAAATFYVPGWKLQSRLDHVLPRNFGAFVSFIALSGLSTGFWPGLFINSKAPADPPVGWATLIALIVLELVASAYLLWRARFPARISG
jgi:hypothetical protein